MVRSKFEDELMFGMQRELHSEVKKQGMSNLVKAAEYLHSALDILEENGMQAQANKVLTILEKLASPKENKVRQLPSIELLLQHGLKIGDLKTLSNDAFARARVNKVFRSAGISDEDMAKVIGEKNIMSKADVHDILSNQKYSEIGSWITDPNQPIGPSDVPNKPQEISFQSQLGGMPRAEDVVFASIAQELGLDDNDAKGKPHKPKNPTKVPKSDTHGLTSEKMIANLKHHGTVFNMADDGAADDLLDAEVGEEPLEVSEPNPDKTFEDSD